MLMNLQVRDFAIVDRIDIEFEPGMTVLTGETGAGKIDTRRRAGACSG